MFKIKLKIQQFLGNIRINFIKEKVGRMPAHSSLISTIIKTILKLFVLLFFGTIILFPFVYMISIALMSDLEVETMDKVGTAFQLFPKEAMWGNFKRAYQDGYLTALLNNILVTAMSIVARIIITALMGYGFAIKKWRFKKTLWAVFLGMMMIPEVALITSQYKVIATLNMTTGGWVFLAMVLPYASSVMSAFMFTNAFNSISDRIKEAAAVDGCGSMTYFWKVAFPMVRPTIWTVTILTAFASWNAYMWPTLITSGDSSKYVLSTWLFNTGKKIGDQGQTLGILKNVRMAASIIVTLPMFIAYFLFRKRIMDAVGKRGSTVKG